MPEAVGKRRLIGHAKMYAGEIRHGKGAEIGAEFAKSFLSGSKFALFTAARSVLELLFRIAW